MVLIGDKKELILIVRKPRSKWYRVVCCGRKKHYRKDGTCKHTEAVLASMKPEIAARTKVDGWGGKQAPNER